MADHRDDPTEERPVTSPGVLLARCFWFFIGPAVLMLTLLGIVNAGSGWATALDVGFFAVVGLMVFSRYWEVRSGRALTGTGEPATWLDFRRYVTVLLPLATALWLAANLVGNHVLEPDVG